MKANMGMLDRVLRVIVAAAIAYLYYTGAISGPLGLALLIIAIIFVLTSLVGFCPLYAPFKMSTRKKA
jgi:Protein of unknown function (DUF2892)